MECEELERTVAMCGSVSRIRYSQSGHAVSIEPFGALAWPHPAILPRSALFKVYPLSALQLVNTISTAPGGISQFSIDMPPHTETVTSERA